MKQPITVDPATYTRMIKETYAEKAQGNIQAALTLAMCAGVDAGILGLPLDQCPFRDPGMFEFELQWLWGRNKSININKQAEQRNLL